MSAQQAALLPPCPPRARGRREPAGRAAGPARTAP